MKGPRCDYAACERPATAQADGWVFCPPHLAEHQVIMAGRELPDLPRNQLPAERQPSRCGTASGARRHYRAGEQPCPACMHASLWERRDREARRRQQVAS